MNRHHLTFDSFCKNILPFKLFLPIVLKKTAMETMFKFIDCKNISSGDFYSARNSCNKYCKEIKKAM